MQYVLLTNQFGGLNTYLTPSKVGPAGAVEATGVDITDGSLQNRRDDTKPTLSSGVWTGTDTYVPATSQTIVPWGIGALGMTGRYAVARFGGRLYRSHKGEGPFPSDLTGIQYTSDTATPPTWDYLGLMTPAALGTPTTSGSTGVPAGTITYYCTFYNALGQESPPASSTAITTTGAKNIAVTLPQAYTTCTTNSSTSLTSVADTTPLRVGMRITGSGIPAGTYITAISGTTVTISQAATSSAPSVKIIDPQIVGTRLYRQGAGIDTPLLVTQTANVTTASYTDTKANDALGEALTTANTADMPTGLRDVAISPEGVLLAATQSSTVMYLSLVTPAIYDPAKVIQVADAPLTTVYALNRFICPTTRGAFTVTIDDAILGLPIVQTIDDTEPSQVSYFVYAVDVGGAVWWNTNKGIVQTDGSTIETVTRYTVDRDTATNFRDCYGADYYNNDYLAYLETGPTTCALYRFNRTTGWSVVTTAMSQSSPGALGFHIGDGCIIYTGSTADSPAAVRRLEASSSRLANGAYRTGDWVGQRQSDLKKFRKVSAVFTGSVSIQPYVDGQMVGSALTGTSAVVNKPERQSWWLPSGTKGRSVSLRVTLTSTAADVQELGVWVGEEREAMP
ncbi:MAG: hypothetical protein VKP62_06425 [Candidatus Sericytochromatia bacterium]|nr:hypothetical protein [Candidatus Sericytochromatia bacterium]